MQGAEVEAWQRFVRLKGFYRGPIDGDFGDDTEAATIGYQKQNGLPADGEVDDDTVERAQRDGFDPSSANGGPQTALQN